MAFCISEGRKKGKDGKSSNINRALERFKTVPGVLDLSLGRGAARTLKP